MPPRPAGSWSSGWARSPIRRRWRSCRASTSWSSCPPVPLKEGAVERIIEGDALRAALYAGDDIADLLAFEALDRAHADGRLEHVVKVAVRGAETPEDLVAAADIVVEGVSEMVDLLATL